VTTLYLHVFDWPKDGKLRVPELKNKGATAELLATAEALPVEAGDNGMVITVPKSAPDKISSTVVLKINGPLQVARAATAAR
jgi:alpha-L-fucosidase